MPPPNEFHVKPEAFAILSQSEFHVKPEAFAVLPPKEEFHVKPEAFAVMSEEVLKLAIRHNGEIIIIPFRKFANAPAVVIHWGGRDWYNHLVAPDSPKASNVLIRYEGIIYAYSLRR